MVSMMIEVLKCDWVLTQNDSREIFNPGFIAYQGSEIIYVGGKAPDFEKDVPIKYVEATGFMAIPGLINSHGHTGMTLLRGMADDMPLMEWLVKKVWPMEQKLTRDDIIWGVRLAMVEMIRSGTTCFNDMYWHNDLIAKMTVEVGMRAALSGALIENQDGGSLLDLATDFFNDWNNHPSGLIKPMFGPHAVYTCSIPFLEKVAQRAGDLDAPIHIHLSETQKELSDCKAENSGRTPVEVLLETGILDRPVTAAHCVHLSGKDVKILKEKSVIPVHNPTSNMKLASGIMPVEKLIEEGIPVSLGTDSAVSNNNLSILQEMKMASLLQKVYQDRAEALPANIAFDMATRNGAAATGFDDRIGQLSPGYFADIVLMKTGGAHTAPFTHPVSHLVYSMHPNDVDTVIINGKTVFSGGEFTMLDETEVLKKCNQIASRVKV